LKAKNVKLLIAAVILLGGAGYLYAREMAARSPKNPPVPVVCENCGTEFYIKSTDKDPVCPKCGAPATVRRLYFKCKQCGHLFVAYEYDSKTDMIREPGGEWYPKADCPLAVQCPECGGETEFVRNVRKPGK
jgi:DNA-directed RNA polymerase subunit RPC12/RpoP